MVENNPPPRRGRDTSEQRIHELEKQLSLISYKHDELEKDFREYQRQTAEKMKWSTGLLVTFIGSIIIPAVTIVITLANQTPTTP